MRRLLAVVAASLALTGAWATVATFASGHASLRSSDPANGELLEEAPDHIRLDFTEPPDVGLTTITVVDASGATVPVGSVELVEGTARSVEVVASDLPDGVFTVSWRTVSRTDGHVTAAAFSFGVGVTAAEVAPVEEGVTEETPPPTVLAVVGRWGLYAGLAALLGAAVAALLALGTRAAVPGWALGVAWALAATGVALTTLEERRVVGVSLGTLLDSDAGGAFVRLGVAVGVVGVATAAVAARRSTLTLTLLAAASAAAMTVRAAGGHAGGDVEAVLQGLHFAAAGTWVGGLLWLAVGIRRGIEPTRVRRFSNLAGVALLVLVTTGFLRAANELGGVGWWLHLQGSDYRVALLTKLAIVVPLIGLGVANRFRNVRRYEEHGGRPLLRTVGGELALAAAVMATTGVLTGLPPQEVRQPARERAASPAPLVVTGSDFATTTRVRLTISPGTVGPNAFVAEVTDFDTGEAVQARRVTLRFSLPDRPDVDSALPLERADDGSWQAGGTALSIDETWDVTVLVEGPSASVEVPLEVTPKPPEQRVDVSRAEGQPDLYTIHLEGGLSVQAYVDPGTPGRPNQVHVTAFDAGGEELPLHHAALEITTSDGERSEPELLRLSAGHYVANVDLEAGTAGFRIDLLTADGRTLVAAFEQTFG